MRDFLKILTVKEVEVLVNNLKHSFPRSLWGHHFLYNHLKCMKSRNNTENISNTCLTIYNPVNANLENCTFIGVTDDNEGFSMFMFTVEESGNELTECIQNSKLINWSDLIAKSGFYYIESRYAKKVDEILTLKGIPSKTYEMEDLYYIPKEEVLTFSVKVPNDVKLKSVLTHHASLINENWTYKDNGSLQLIKNLIQLNGGSGIFKADNNELISWIVTNQYYHPGFLYTVENERRKGYGNLVFKAECKRLVENDQLDVCVVIAQGNKASLQMITKLGFKHVTELSAIIY